MLAPVTKPPPKAPKAPDPELAPLEASFERGDFARLGEALSRLPEAVRTRPRAAALRGATSVDGAHVAVIALCVLALIAITLRYLG